MLTRHWEDDRWREVILLAAGVLGVVDGHQSNASAYVTSLRQLDPVYPANTGRGAMLAAGRWPISVCVTSIRSPRRDACG